MRCLPAGLVALALVMLPGPAHAQGADAQAWWSSLHRSALPAPPAPPDVGASDLLLQGGDVGRLLPDTGVVSRSPAPTALAALRFHVARDAQVGRLVLRVATGAKAADVRAYPTASSWAPVQGGAIEDAPTPDLSRYSSGALSTDGATLVFNDIGRLLTEDGLLSVVLVPGPTDRVVLHAPLPTALTVVLPSRVSVQPSTPPDPPAVVPPPVPVVGVGLPPVANVPAVVPAPSLPAPALAVATTPTTATSVGRVVPDSSRDRLLVGIEALLVLAFFGLLGQGPFAVLARLTGEQLEERTERGVGRFVRARTGAPPKL